MEFFRRSTRIDFMAHRRIAISVSVLLIVISILAVVVRGMNFGIDFTGGTIIEIGFPKAVDVAVVRRGLHDSEFRDATVQHFGTSQDLLVRWIGQKPGDHEMLRATLVQRLSDITGMGPQIRRVEFVGPQVGDELTERGGLAFLIALGGILLYVAFRFEWRFAVASVIALLHDAIITVGVFAVFRLTFDLSVFAALLAVIGYSLNDTIVVFDRVRDDFRIMRNASSVEVVNAAINQTLSRTIMTGVTTLMVLMALILLGGPTLFGFSLALIVGVIVGTYSSVYVASAAVLALGVSRGDLIPKAVEEPGDSRP
ncbi:MAG: protein translocase subunit SecF [Gammaproteobacteria bacterium]|nr:protein translocase subunit SecF [Gammaproteobacteria bacterium]